MAFNPPNMIDEIQAPKYPKETHDGSANRNNRHVGGQDATSFNERK